MTDDLPYQRQDGSSGLLQAHIMPFDHPVTGERMMLGISRDVTEERQASIERETRAAFERELDIARRVQHGLLPLTPPNTAGFDIAARSEPAMFAGGDFYDFVECADGRVVAVIGDVTGHGVGPAIIAASCRAFSRALFPELRLNQALAKLDAHVTADTADGTFVTLAAFEIMPDQNHVSYCSAGHGPVILTRPGDAYDMLPTQCPPLGLGLARQEEIQSIELDLAAGDQLLIPSDGLIESCSPEGTQRGVDGLLDAATAGSAEGIVAECFAADARWRDGSPTKDDQTLIVIQRL